MAEQDQGVTPPRACQNCREAEHVETVRLDMDLPTIDLCRIFRVAISADRELFEERGRKIRG